MRGPLHALLRLRGVEIGDELPAVLAGCAKRWSIDIGPLAHLREATDAALDALVGLLDAAIRDVDSTTEETPA